MKFTDWAMNELKDLPNTKSAYNYKQNVIVKMTDKANELVAMGLTDNNVIDSLLQDEFKNIKKEYYEIKDGYEKKKKKTKAKKLIIAGGIFYIFLLTLVFLIISFATNAWNKTWLTFILGLLIPAGAGMLGAAFKLNSKSLALSLVSRLLSATGIILITVVSFLSLEILTSFEKSWLCFIFGVFAIIVCDILLAVISKQKTVLISALIYIPVLAALIYASTGIMGIVPWHPGWLIVVCSVLLDLAIIIFNILKKPTVEAEEQWEDD